VKTGNRSGAGTDAWIYLGIGGREFSVDSAADDFQMGTNRDYIFGDNSNVNCAQYNDPREPELDTADIDRFPVYVRLEPHGNSPAWNVEDLQVTVSPGSATYRALWGAEKNLWLGQSYGKCVYLKKV
jgi:hypothetical protein